MKKACLIICIAAACMTFVSASVWEGAAATAASGELPETGLFVATGSFPVNTVVDVMNLENERTVQVIVSSGLDNPGLLALLSKDAAEAIGLDNMTPGRIRMSQPADLIAFSRFTEGRMFSGDPDFDPAAFVSMNSLDPDFLEEGEPRDTGRMEGGDLIVDLPDDLDLDAYTGVEFIGSTTELTLVPAETRPPARGPEPDPNLFVPRISTPAPQPAAQPSSVLDPTLFVAPIGSAPASAQYLVPAVPAQPEQIFSAPMINSLEMGRYYIQLAAFSKIENVRAEISKIDRSLPVAIMNAGTAAQPLYRLLIGPVNLGESGALLQRFKVTYKDAFVRLGT